MVERQAVLLIHGIGEQRPMDTLRGFVNAVWLDDIAVHNAFSKENAEALVWSKPDTVSDSFELRRLTTIRNTAGIRTDFLAFYWQHLTQGTTYGHVFAWARTLLRGGFLSHILFWKTDARAHVIALRDALDLTDSRNPARQALSNGV